MKSSYYFPHDYHARHDPKLEKLRMEIGPVGDGIYWDLVEMLYEEGGYLPLKNMPLIAKALNTTEELVNKVVKSAELFEIKRDKFYSESALRRLKHIKNKTKKARENAEKRWDVERFKKAKKGLIFYVIRLWNDQEEFIKVGITGESIARRFSGGLASYQYEVLFNADLAQTVAIKLEETIAKECKKFTPSERISGYLECYDSSEKDKILSLMPRHCHRSAIKESKVKESKVKEIKDIVGDLNQVLNSSYKPTSSKNRELIEARLAEGFTVEDFKVVHRKMAKAWGIDNKMRQFLRPITLYSNKFESYLNRPEDIRQLTTQQQSNLKQLQELRTESKDDKSIV